MLLPKELPKRSPKYLAFIRTLPCLVCGSSEVHAHHVHTGGLSTKAGDDTCVPLCGQRCHPEVHRIGRKSFQKKYGIDFEAVIKRLNKTWEASNGITE